MPGVCLRGHGRGLRPGNTVMLSGLYSAGCGSDACQIWAADAAVDYVVVSSAPVSAASQGWQQFRGLGLFPWAALASFLHPYAYLTLRSLMRSMVRPLSPLRLPSSHVTCLTHPPQLHLLSASVNDVDVVCADGPAHQIIVALGWCGSGTPMPVLDGLQTRFFKAERGGVAAGLFAPIVVSLQFVRECSCARTQSLSQEEAMEGCSDWAQDAMRSFPIHELCLSREPSLLQHVASNTVAALEAAGHEQVVADFVGDWFGRSARDELQEKNVWLVWMPAVFAAFAWAAA